MIELIKFRSLIFWWGLLTATYFLQGFLKQSVQFFRNPSFFNTKTLPFSLLFSIDAFLNSIAEQISKGVQFNPNNVIVKTGGLTLYSWMLAAGFALLLIGVAFIFYYRAIKSSEWWDDTFALVTLYTMLRVVGHIVAIAQMPIDNTLRAIVDDRNVTFIVMLVFTAGLVFIGEGFRHKRTFWRSVISVSFVALFMFPAEAAQAIAWGMEALVYFGSQLNISANPTFTVIWGAIGMTLALQRLVLDDKPGGGGGPPSGAPKPGGGKPAGKPGGGVLGGLKLPGAGGGGDKK